MLNISLRLPELFLILTPTKLHIWPQLGTELQLSIDLLGWNLMTRQPSLTKKIPPSRLELSGVCFLQSLNLG